MCLSRVIFIGSDSFNTRVLGVWAGIYQNSYIPNGTLFGLEHYIGSRVQCGRQTITEASARPHNSRERKRSINHTVSFYGSVFFKT